MENTFGVPSVTRPGDMDYTTKKGDMMFHQNGMNIKKPYKPFSFHKGTMSRTHPGDMNFTTKKGSKVFHRKGKYVRKSYKPYSRKRN